MICQQCNTVIDDDLVFCTNCGQRLAQPPPGEMPTVVQPRAAMTVAEKKSGKALWIVLGFVFVTLTASIATVFILRTRREPVAATNTANATPKATAKPATPKPTVNAPTATPVANANRNANAVEPTPAPGGGDEIVKERIELEPNSDYSVPFSSDGDRDIVGNVKVLRGGDVAGFVYSKEMFDEHYPDETFKTFSIGPGRNLDVKQRLVKEDYVLVFVNDSDRPCLIELDFSLK